MLKLKDCPFCGAPGDTKAHSGVLGQPTIVRAGCSQACCPSMWATSENDSIAAVRTAMIAAIDRWNTRTEKD